MRNRALLFLLAAAATLGMSEPAVASDARGHAGLAVTARVRPVVRTELTGLSVVTISESDIRRGHIDVAASIATPGAAAFRSGYLVRYEIDPAVARRARIGDLSVGPGGAFRIERRLALDESSEIRIELAERVVPGEYESPITISVHPLLEPAPAPVRPTESL